MKDTTMRSRLNVSLEQCQCEQGQSNKTTADVSVPQDSGDGSNPATYNQGNGQEELILMTGPLGEVYTKALSQYFAKTPVDGVEELAVESQAQDAVLTSTALREHIKRVSEQGANVRVVDQSATLVKTPRVIAYVVPARASTRPETIITVKGWVDRAKGSGREVILICDSRSENDNWMGTNASVVLDDKIPSPYDVGQNFVRATEDYYEPIGVTVVNGARGFVDWVKENCGQGKYVTDSVSTEGFLDAIKALFSTKKQLNTDVKNKDADKREVALKKAKLEYERDFGKVNKVLVELTKTSFVKDNCPDQKSGPEAKDLAKSLSAILKAQHQFKAFVAEVDRVNEKNVASNNAGEPEENLIDLTPMVRSELSRLPTDFGFGIKFKVFDTPDNDKPVWLAENFDEDAKISDISKIKLSQSDVVLVSRLVTDIQKNNYSKINTYFKMFFDKEREGKEGGANLASKYYYSDYELCDMLHGSVVTTTGENHIGAESAAEDIVDGALKCLNNHIKDKADLVSTEGFLDAVKSFFSKKKKENDSSTPKELPKEISVPLNKMTNLSWVKQHCVYDESTQNNPDLKKFVENLTKAENVLMKVKQIVDKLNGDNLKAVPENYDKKSELKKVRDGVFHDVIKAAETEMNNFPRDLGFGVKLTKKQSPRENFPRYDLEVSEAAIKDVKLSADQIVHLARFLSGDRYFNYVVIGWVLDDNELSDRFDIEWESEGGETAEAALDRYNDKFYLDEEKALDMFGGLISSAHDILYAQYVCLNNHIKDNASKVE